MSSSLIVEKSPANPSHLSETRKSSELKEPDSGPEREEHEHGVEWTELIRIAFVALAAAAVWFRLWEPFPHISVIGIAATLIGGYPIFKEAFENIVERKMTMELSMTIALLSALAIGEFFTALVITGFVLAAEVWRGSQLVEAGGLSRVFSIFSPEPSRSAAMTGDGSSVRPGSSW
jgi:cation transport ATPase